MLSLMEVSWDKRDTASRRNMAEVCGACSARLLVVLEREFGEESAHMGLRKP